MLTTNLDLIEKVQDEIIDFSQTSPALTYQSWYPELLKWKNTLQNSCRELKAFQRYSDESFKSIKKSIKAELLILLDEVRNCSEVLNDYDENELFEVYNGIEDKIDAKSELIDENLFVILYVTLNSLLKRIETDDYSEFYELISLASEMKEEAENEGGKIGSESKRGEKKSIELRGKQIGWIMIFRGQSHFSKDDIILNYSNYNAESIYNRKTRINGDYNKIQQGLRPEYCSRKFIIKDLEKVIEFFKEKGEIENAVKAKKMKDLTQEKLDQED